MDNLILEGVVGELRSGLIGWPVFKAASPRPTDLLLLFDDPARSRLLLSAAAELPRLHLTTERISRKDAASGAFAAGSAHHLSGAILTGIEKEPGDRIVRLRFAGPAGPGMSLIAELLGRSSNLLLVDEADKIVGFCRHLKSEYRGAVMGASYEPPRRGHRLDPRTLSEKECEDLAERSRRESHPLADLLLEVCPSLGPLAAREIEARSLAGEVPYAAVRRWVDRAFEDLGAPPPRLRAGDSEPEGLEGESEGAGPTGTPGGPCRTSESRETEPSGTSEVPGRVPASDGNQRAELSPRGYVYAEGPLDRLDPRRALGPGRLAVSPLPLASADPDLIVVTYPTLNEACDACFTALASGGSFRARRDALATIARREAKRADGISLKVANDLRGLEGATKHRRFGEALLAGLTQAERRGSDVIVPDPYDESGGLLAIPIDPSLSLARNAERYFSRHRKTERGRVSLAERLVAQRQRSEALSVVAGTIEAASDHDALDDAEAGLRDIGIAVGLERRRPARDPEPRPAGVRLYTSSEAYEILVGKGADENDRLTFKIAGPEDFWLHASGASGAHVVVRNPRGEGHLPAVTLREAAELAGFFSKAKEAGRAEVMVTRRKYVRRIRGAPRGTVTVKKHETIAVKPRNPFE